MEIEPKAIMQIRNPELVVSGNGRKAIQAELQVSASDEATADQAVQALVHLAKSTGREISVQTKEKTKGSSHSFIGTKKWNAPWQPTGPKPPWSRRPQDN